MFKIYLVISLVLSGEFAMASAAAVKQSILNTYGCQSNPYVCKAINENISRDSNGCRVLPNSIELLETHIKNRSPATTKINVFDRIRYFGPITGVYSYEYARLKNRKFNITAKMHFKNIQNYSDAEVQYLKAKFKQAAHIWNQNNPFRDIYTFDFQLAARASADTVSASLVKFQTRGPYFDKWSILWSPETVAHEFGHVLGLHDEYDYFHQGSSVPECDQSSIMCSSWGRPKAYHYHLVLQRSFCEV